MQDIEQVQSAIEQQKGDKRQHSIGARWFTNGIVGKPEICIYPAMDREAGSRCLLGTEAGKQRQV